MNKLHSHLALRAPLAAAVGALTVTMALPVLAQTAASDTMAAKAALDRADRKFLENAAAGGMAEVQLGTTAGRNGASGQVRQFGQRMVQDHGKADEEIQRIAAAKGVQLPTQPTQSQRSMAEKLAKKTGADFDKAYMKDMVDDHKKDIAEFQKAAQSAKDSDVKDFAARTLPTLQEHLQMAQAAWADVKDTK